MFRTSFALTCAALTLSLGAALFSTIWTAVYYGFTVMPNEWVAFGALAASGCVVCYLQGARRRSLLGAALAMAVVAKADPIPPGGVGQNVEAVGYSNLNDKPGFKMSIQKVGERWYLYLGMLWNEGWHIVVRPALSSSSAAWTARSVSLSSALVASSSTRIGGLRSTVRAMAIRCFSPPLKR